MIEIESAAAGSIPVLFIEHWKAKELYLRIGLRHKKNCLFFEDLDFLEHMIKNWFTDKTFMANIREGAIAWSKTQTNRERIEQILENLEPQLNNISKIQVRDDCAVYYSNEFPDPSPKLDYMRKDLINSAISAPSSSRAKCPVSNR